MVACGPWLARFAVRLGLLAIAALPLMSAVKLEVREGRAFANGVFVNGHGPYRFLIDTGTNMNLIETGLARKIGMEATFQDFVDSALGKTQMPGNDGNVVELGSVRAENQRFQFSKLESLHAVWPDVQGVLGQAFLASFDYLLDLRHKTLEFGKQERAGNRVQFRLLNGRSALATNLGDLVVDSGAAKLLLFGVGPGDREQVPMLTLTGSENVGMVSRRLAIDGRDVWRGSAVALPGRSEPGIAGLMPISLFKSVYICNSEGYVVLE
ncbi:MAG: retropepsin-like domain-containing protein [Acidobacteriota bacterium]|nr:retropepsin-like domain-containing protein [Acidobacteriota bacterium]